MNNTPIYISHDDNAKLRLLLSAALYSNASAALVKLRDELDRAVIIDPAAIPADIVTMESLVEFEDLSTGEVEEYTITFPERSNVDEKRLSILTPIGTALIGCREGDILTWNTPGGARELKIRRVLAPAPASATPALLSAISWR
ncbi:nucleoside diphosphate kinase regulator [Rariglobus hedericola]|uniref:Nucleoside diphosphate kinase regulator n=1 Tax=Rariglobus hedericola TaxID=2597822 RepID=A0A556QM57_9BACT|nr:nucleoside diphosphate kinase regulator [Rariglobus hedericola]TSJ77739.1 nucleoside diphosphate kinase regulator [Rariglobus hedericola]